jgi:hypothetical protein
VALASGNFVIGAGLAIEAYPGNWSLNPTTLFWFPLLLGLGMALGAFAGIYRLPNAISPLNSAKNPPSFDPQKRQRLLRNGLMILIVGLGLAISERVFFAGMVIWGLLFLLNEAPLELRKAPILRNLLEVMALFGAALAGFAAFGAPMIGFPGKWMFVLLVPTMLGSIALDQFRKGDSIVPWYPDWLSGWQRWFRILGIALLVSAALVAAWALNGQWQQYCITLLLFCHPIPAIIFKIKRMQAAIATAFPVWIYWVSQVFGWL